ncbi:MAG: hypothetical protein V2A73_18245, partial [Pseudomonadota bacterium]
MRIALGPFGKVDQNWSKNAKKKSTWRCDKILDIHSLDLYDPAVRQMALDQIAVRGAWKLTSDAEESGDEEATGNGGGETIETRCFRWW